MSLHSLRRVQLLPISIQEAWDFFTSPLNLSVITPPEMNFKILSSFKPSDKVYEEMLINYFVSPLFHIPLQWQTEITKVESLKFFIDEQRKGPFAVWHHEHYFKPLNDGVEMTDVVNWKVPFGFLGDIVNSIVVKRKVEEIFSFREKKLKELFH
jgi:ligand-binding SRPBCC domain-containing protein